MFGEFMKKYYFRFKKYIIIVILIFISFLTSCKKNLNKDYEITILSINDFHGQLESTSDGCGAARIAKFVEDSRKANPDYTVLLSAGDSFQGTAISNVSYGRDVINFMNMVNFDAMAIGNHEFDWGLETILAYRDGESDNGEADFPFINTNIYQKSSNGLPEYLDEYTIVEREDIKIAIISYIGYDQTSDISENMISDYEFLQPLNIVRENIKKVRTEEDADFVVICCHDDTSSLTNLLATGEDEYKVDAIINAHSHSLYNKRIYRSSDNTFVPVIQSGSSGQYVGMIKLEIDGKTNTVSNSTVVNNKMSSSREESEEIKSFVLSLQVKYSPIFDRKLCVAGTNISRLAGTTWAVKALYNYGVREYGACDIAFINTGGIRKNAFPIASGSEITVNVAYKIMPFDNLVKITKLLGKDVINAIGISDVVYAGNVSSQNGIYYINGEKIIENKYYNVITIDYIFDKAGYPFKNGIDTISTDILFRDVLIREFEIIDENNELWLG